MIKILYVIPELTSGGTERLVFDLCRLIDTGTFAPSVCAFHSGSYEQQLRDLGIPVHLLVGETRLSVERNLLSKISDFKGRVKALDGIIGAGQFDIINSHHIGTLLHLFFSRECRRRFWMHTEHIRPDIENAGSTLLRAASWLYRRPNILSGVSAAVISYYQETLGIAPEKTRLVLNGINVTAFSRSVDAVCKRLELGLSERDVVVGTMANLRPQKNHKNLVTAFALVRNQLPGLKLLLAGDGECRRELEAQARTLGVVDRVLFLGHRTDADELMAVLDVYCLPSLYEGMPLSIMEAWAAGKPVVATDVLGTREIVQDGVTGILVPSDNPEALASALLKVIEDTSLRSTLADNGRKLAFEKCSIEQMIGKYELLYRELAGN